MSSAFASILQARPCPTFGRPVHLWGSPLDYGPVLLLMPFGFHLTVDTLPSGVPQMAASGPPWPVSGFRLRARLGFSIPSSHFGQRGITPAFGYGAPHLSAGGTSTLPIWALPSAHYDEVRLLVSVHHRLRLLTFPMRTVLLTQHLTARYEISQVPMRSLCT